MDELVDFRLRIAVLADCRLEYSILLIIWLLPPIRDYSRVLVVTLNPIQDIFPN